MNQKRSALSRAAGLLGGVAGRVIIAALLLLLTVEGLRFCYVFGHSIFYQEPVEAAPGTDHVVTLADGVTMSSVSDQLYEEGLIRNKTAFVIQGELYRTKLYPGEYTLNTSMTTKEILAVLNTEPEEYALKLQEEAAEAEKSTEEEESVIGGGDDLVDEAQASAAADEGILVTPEDTETTAVSGQTGAAAGQSAGEE